MKIGFICDMHLPASKASPQYAFLEQGISALKKDDIRTIINLGDISACGETEALNIYFSAVSDLEHYFVIGNSDVRDANTRDAIGSSAKGFVLRVGKRKIVGINTPYSVISEAEKPLVDDLENGDILVLHHAPKSLAEESRVYLEEILNFKNITVIHGHSHCRMDYTFGKSHIIGIRAIDPDKSIGDFPCAVVFDIADDGITYAERFIEVDKKAISEVSDYFGLACADNLADLRFAIDNRVKYVELRCANRESCLEDGVTELVNEWRAKTNGYLSIHFPNLYYDENGFRGEEAFKSALDLANLLKVDGITIHPPKTHISYMENDNVKNRFTELYASVAKNVADNVKIGIENLHLGKGENATDRNFGYTPDEVSNFVDLVNKALNKEGRVGHLLDVGHARNNGVFSQKYPVGRWYGIIGKKVVAYHLHQVVRVDGKLKNHQPVEDWFGPMISFASFFYCWKQGILKHAPIFLEVRGHKNFKKSIDAFKKTFEMK